MFYKKTAKHEVTYGSKTYSEADQAENPKREEDLIIGYLVKAP